MKVKKQKNYPVQPLVRLLQYWHFYATVTRFVLNYDAIVKKDGKMTVNMERTHRAVSQHADFETWLLNAGTRDLNPVDFIGIEKVSEMDWLTEEEKQVRDLHFTALSIPGMMYSWTKHSRRVYDLPEDLQLLFSNTSLAKADWSKVRLPFKSFLLNLSVPIIDRFNQEYKAILVSEYPSALYAVPGRSKDDDTYVTLTLIPESLPTIQTAFIGDELIRANAYAARGDVFRAMKIAQHAFERNTTKLPRAKLVFSTFFYEDPQHVKICEEEETLRDASEHTGEEFMATYHQLRTVMRIFFGFLLYRQTMPTGKTLIEQFSPDDSRAVLPAKFHGIAKSSLVCHVQSVYKPLDSYEKDIFRQAMQGTLKRELSCHLREGHWRRRPGLGQDPDAEKTVEVRATVVRPDKLEPGTLPMGTMKKAG